MGTASHTLLPSLCSEGQQLIFPSSSLKKKKSFLFGLVIPKCNQVLFSSSLPPISFKRVVLCLK